MRTCALVKDVEQLLSEWVRPVAVYSESDERTNADIQPESPANSRFVRFTTFL